MSISHKQQPLFRQVARALRRELAEGRYAVGERLPSVRRLAGQHFCSLTVIQCALRELFAEGLVVSDSTRGIRVKALPATSEHAGRVVCIFPRWDSLHEESFAAQFLLGASLAGTECGFAVEPFAFTTLSELAPVIDRLCRNRPVGVVWANPHSPVPLMRLQQAGVRLVTSLRHYDAVSCPGTLDDFDGVLPDLLDAIVARNAHRLAVLGMSTEDETYEPILKRLLGEAEARGLQTDPARICRARAASLDGHARTVLLKDFLAAVEPGDTLYSFAPDALMDLLRIADENESDLVPSCTLVTHSIRTAAMPKVDMIVESNIRAHGAQAVKMLRTWLEQGKPASSHIPLCLR